MKKLGKFGARILSPVVVGILSRVVSQLTSVALIVIVSRNLDLAGFGIFALAWASTVISVTLIYTGFYHAILRSEDPERDVATFFWLMLMLGAVGSGLMGITGAWLVSGELGSVLLGLAALPLLNVIVAWNEAQLVAGGRTRAAAIYQALGEIVGLLVVIAAFQSGHGVMALVAGRMAVTMTGIAITCALVRRLPRLELRRETMRRSWENAVPLWISAVVTMFSNYGSDFALAAFLSPASVGAYRGGSRVAATAFDVVGQPLGMLNWAKFARLERQNRIGDLREAWLSHAAFSAFLTWPILTALAVLAPEITLVVLGDDWLAAVPVIMLLSISRVPMLFGLMMTPTLTCLGRGRQQMRLRIISAVLILIMLGIAGPLGPVAVAAGHVVVTTVFAALCIAAMVEALGIALGQILSAIVPGLVMSAVCFLVILLARDQFGALDPALGLAAIIGLLATGWIVAVGLLVQVRVLALPTP